MNKEFKIDEQLRDLFPPLTKEEFDQLEQNIIRDGCTSPLFIWNDYIVDGHNRYNICTKHNLDFKAITLAYETKEDIIQWMIDTQLGRRNLTPIQRIEIAEKYRPIFKKKAEENLRKADGGDRKSENFKKQGWQKTSKVETLHTRDELSKIAGVSHDTYSKGKKILESDNEKIKEKVRKGELKIGAAYKELFPKVKEEGMNQVDCETLEYKDEVELVPPEPKNDIVYNIKKSIKDIKTPKFFVETFDFLNEIDIINENLKHSIETARDSLFTRDIDGILEQYQKNIALEVVQQLIDQMIDLKNKINNIKIKESI